MKKGLIVAFILTLLFSLFSEAKMNADLSQLNKARRNYATKKYSAAVAAYSQISKESDFWPTAIEERAHTFGRRGEYDKALADLTTLFSPVFVQSLHPEVYFTAALTYLRLCQYNKIFETFKMFKSNMTPRIESLEKIANRKSDDLIFKAVEAVQKNGFTTISYVKDANLLPQLFHHDHKMRDLIQIFKTKPSTKKFISRRMSELAQEDLNEIKINLNRLQLVEAEVMQRLNIQEKNKDLERRQSGRFSRQKNQMIFPYNGEVWLDELDSYQVKTRACPQGAGA